MERFIGKILMPHHFEDDFPILNHHLWCASWLLFSLSLSHWDRFHSTKLNVCMKSLQELSLFKNNHLRWLANLPSIRKKRYTCVKMGSSSSPPFCRGEQQKFNNKNPLKLLNPNPTQVSTPFFLVFWTVNGIYGNWWIIRQKLGYQPNRFFLFYSMLGTHPSFFLGMGTLWT